MSARGRTDRRRLGFGVALAAILLASGTAIAGSFDPRPGDMSVGRAGGIKYVKDSDAFDTGNGYASDAIWCGHGRRVTGGGARLGGGAASRFLASSLPRDVYLAYGDDDDIHDDSWDASGYGPDGKTLTAFGICVKGAHLRYVYLDVPDSTTGNRSAQVSCGGGGYHAVGGGGLIAPSESWTNASYPIDGGDSNKTPDDGWRVRVFDPVGGIGGFVIEVICMRGESVEYERAKVAGVGAGDGGNRRAGCDRGEPVLGGGVKVGGPQNAGRVASSHPFDDSDARVVPDDGWKGTGYNVSGSPKSVTAYAICLA